MTSLREMLSAVIVVSCLFISVQFIYVHLRASRPRRHHRSAKSSIHDIITSSQKPPMTVNDSDASICKPTPCLRSVQTPDTIAVTKSTSFRTPSTFQHVLVMNILYQLQ